MTPPNGRRTASVVWELSEDEGMVVVDVDAPLRPFGSLTPPHGTRPLDVSDTLPDEEALAEPVAERVAAPLDKAARLFADDPMAGAWDEEPPPSDGLRRTLPPLARS